MHSHPLLAQLEALQEAEQFAARFEGDTAQQPAVTDLLVKLRTQINVTLIALDTLRVQLACRVANTSSNDWATKKLFVAEPDQPGANAAIKPTEAEIASFKAKEQAKEGAKRQRLANLPTGTCPECEGEGTLYSALHSTKCPECNGSGKHVLQQGTVQTSVPPASNDQGAA